MKVAVLVGDILYMAADVLICPANPWLNLSGGIGGAILLRDGVSIQKELHEFLEKEKRRAVPAGTVVVTSAGRLPFNRIFHAVAIDPFYNSSVELVRETLRSSFELAKTYGASSISVPALATGYGRLPIEDFAQAAAPLLEENLLPHAAVQFVLKSEENARSFRQIALNAT